MTSITMLIKNFSLRHIQSHKITLQSMEDTQDGHHIQNVVNHVEVVRRPDTDTVIIQPQDTEERAAAD